MPRSYDQKLKIFYIRDYLEKYSHSRHPIPAAELVKMLWEEHEIKCDRKTIYSDIEALQRYGLDIVSLQGPGGGYYIASRSFELPELKLLIDAVQSSRYLTENKSRELIAKLCDMCSVHDARLMRRNIQVTGRVKSMNESIYNNLDYIQEAIAQNRQISFRYFDWDMQGQRSYRNKPYLASPYGLCHDNDYCYLVGWTERHDITHFRVDRMSNIKITDQPRIPCPSLTGKAFTEYALDEAALAKWDRIIAVRTAVNGALETARNEKKIGKGLEASVALTVPAADAFLAEMDANELADLLIVSQVAVTVGEALSVTVEAAEGEKCQRCWKVLTAVGTVAEHSDLCPRCAAVVKTMNIAE